MAIVYNGPVPDRNYCIYDFYANGVVLTSFHTYRYYETNKRHLQCVFRSNGLKGIIRTTCYGNTYAVDVKWGHLHSQLPNESCLTTECKTLREAKSILFMWFKSQRFVKSKTTKTLHSLEFKYYQATLSPFIFR